MRSQSSNTFNNILNWRRERERDRDGRERKRQTANFGFLERVNLASKRERERG